MVTSGAGDEEVKYKGVRKRKWGKWVSEVRLPNSRERIWLGSYDSPAKAARAFDAAASCLRGRRAPLNFPDDPPAVPTAGSLTYQQIQELAARHAHSAKAAATVPAAAAATAAAATPTEVETTAVNSPIEEVAAEATAVDWSLLDMMEEGYPVIDEFFYDHMVLLPPTVGPADGAGEEGGCGVGMTSSLWNF